MSGCLWKYNTLHLRIVGSVVLLLGFGNKTRFSQNAVDVIQTIGFHWNKKALFHNLVSCGKSEPWMWQYYSVNDCISTPFSSIQLKWPEVKEPSLMYCAYKNDLVLLLVWVNMSELTWSHLHLPHRSTPLSWSTWWDWTFGTMWTELAQPLELRTQGTNPLWVDSVLDWARIHSPSGRLIMSHRPHKQSTCHSCCSDYVTAQQDTF